MQERAIKVESNIVGKRAIALDRASKCERVMIDDRTSAVERAKPSESTNAPERATSGERTKTHERPAWLTQYLNEMVTKPKHCKKYKLERTIELLKTYETAHPK